MLDLDNIESDEYSRRLKLLDGLKSALRTQSLSFVERFIELDGLTRLLEFLLSMNTGTVSVLNKTAIFDRYSGRTGIHGPVMLTKPL